MEVLWKSWVFSKLLLNARYYLCYHGWELYCFPVTVINLFDDIPPSKLYICSTSWSFPWLLDTDALPCKAEPGPLITRWAFHLEICALGACFDWFILLYFILVYQLSFRIVRTGLGAWAGDWDSFPAIRGCRGSVSAPFLPRCCPSCWWRERKGTDLHRPSLLLAKAWTKTCRTAGSGVLSSQLYLKQDASGFWQGSSYSSQGWNQMTLQTLRQTWCFGLLTRHWQHQFPQLWDFQGISF